MDYLTAVVVGLRGRLTPMIVLSVAALHRDPSYTISLKHWCQILLRGNTENTNATSKCQASSTDLRYR